MLLNNCYLMIMFCVIIFIEILRISIDILVKRYYHLMYTTKNTLRYTSVGGDIYESDVY